MINKKLLKYLQNLKQGNEILVAFRVIEKTPEEIKIRFKKFLIKKVL